MIQRYSFFIILAFSLLSVNAQDPTSSVTHFHNLPARLFFFDHTETAIYHDVVTGNVFVSENEGKSWRQATDIPDGDSRMVIEHPFNNRLAFVITRGTRHYRTDDRGKTWRHFDMPIRPALVGKPFSFHSDPVKYGYILYQGTKCDGIGWTAICHDETYLTKQAFSDEPQLLLTETTSCNFAHSSVDFKHDAHPDLIYCVAFDTSSRTGMHALSSSRLFSSTDFFVSDNKVEDLGIGKNAKGVLAFAIVSKFAVVAMKDLAPGNNGEMLLYVSVDTVHWANAQFPLASTARLRENSYTIVESTTHSLAVDVLLQEMSSIGTLFVSNSNGTFFVESLKDTNRNDMGFVDYENLYGVDGVGLANVVVNAEDVKGRGSPKLLATVITFDDGSSWKPVRAPSVEGISCDPSNIQDCSLHFHSVTTPHNFGRIFSSPAPGYVMGVGSIGQVLQPYELSDTFLSTDAGVTWNMVRKEAHKYEFGDQGSIIVTVNDEEEVDTVSYSTDLGKTWKSYNLGLKLRARILTTIPGSTSQKFLLLGQVRRGDSTKAGRFALVWLDFATLGRKQCEEADFERWYARTQDKECLMGHKQWYKRRKENADCYIGHKFEDSVEHEENCECSKEDYECDYNFVRNGDKCDPVGPEPIAAGICTGQRNQTYLGSSGWRKIPGNTCYGGLGLDKKVEKDCSQAEPAEGEITHRTFEFPSRIDHHAYFKDSTTILVRLSDYSIWQSSNEGYTWTQLFPDEHFLSFYHHSYTPDRAYLITNTKKFFYTTDTGQTWNALQAPTIPNSFGLQVLHFQPQSEYLIWTGDEGCSVGSETCHVVSHYSRDNGRRWTHIESYVRNCAWARDAEIRIDPAQILCESYQDKTGSQRNFGSENALQLIGGTDFFAKRTKLFDHVVGFAKFSEYLIVAEYLPQRGSLDLQVSLDGRTFATGMFPPSMHPDTHAYTVLESSTNSVFLHMTMSEPPNPFWGNILKSNSNGTYFGLSIEHVNRDGHGFVDFEKMIGLDGIALINVVSNVHEAAVTGRKALQSRITHNDGSTWKPLVPPKIDSFQRKYECDSVKCALHLHGYTERYDARATYSTPSVVGLIMAVGSVSETLAPYTESDTFLSRDAGFTWQEVHKDAHLWEFGDSGSILVMANDEEPTDHVLYSTDEGLNWHEYKFGNQKIRVRTIVTVPSDTSRRFILMGSYPLRQSTSVVVHLDFSSLTWLQCRLNLEDPGHDDFELWSPSQERQEKCLFGRQTMYHRRVRDRNCVVGKQQKAEERVVKNCPCAPVDFECEFNYVKNAIDECVLVPGTTPLPDDDSCRNGEDYWYERTAYRKIPFSTCEDITGLDRGARHVCPGFKAHGLLFWLTVFVLPFGFTALVAYWYYRRSGMARGTIRLPGDAGPRYRGDSGVIATLASVPWFLVGLAGIAWEYVSSSVDKISMGLQSRRGYRDLPVDEDAQILRFEDEE